MPAGFALGCTAPAAPSPPPPLSSVSTSPLPQTPEAIEALRGEVEDADKYVRAAADEYERACPTADPTVPVDEEMCRQIKPSPDSPKGKLATAGAHCSNLVSRYNEAVSSASHGEQIILGVTPNRKYGDSITC